MSGTGTAPVDKNKIVPTWLRVTYVLPCLLFFAAICYYMGNVYMYIAGIEAEIFDGSYYVILTFLLMVLVYVAVLLVCLIPAFILTTITRKILDAKQRSNQTAVGGGNAQSVVSDRNKYN